MQGLTNIERNGCKTMLGLLSKGDILSLTDTVTNKMIAAESVTGEVH